MVARERMFPDDDHVQPTVRPHRHDPAPRRSCDFAFGMRLIRRSVPRHLGRPQDHTVGRIGCGCSHGCLRKCDRPDADAELGLREPMTMGTSILISVISVIVGFLLSWAIAHRYYRRASRDMDEQAQYVPRWAVPLIESLPDHPVSTARLIELYHSALENGEVSPDPSSGYLACPKCGAPSDEFEPWEAVDHTRDDAYHGVRCGRCGADVSWSEI